LLLARTGIRLWETDLGDDRIALGSAVGIDDVDVRTRAFAEAVERAEWIRASAAPRAVRAGSSAKLFGDRRCEWCGHADDHVVDGRALITEEPAVIPARFVFQRWSDGPGRVPGARVDATGVAAGSSRDDAVRRALLEVLERHTAILAWRMDGVGVTTSYGESLGERVSAAVRALGLRPTVLRLALADLPPTHLVVLTDSRGHATIGTACGRDRDVDAATFEALALRWAIVRGCGASPSVGLRRVRQAFALQGLATRWRDLQSAYQQPEAPAAEVSLDELGRRITRSFGEPVIVDLTSEQGRDAGWSVVRAVIPGVARRECADRHGPAKAMLSQVVAGMPDPHPFG